MHRPWPRPWLALCLAPTLLACSTALSTMQPADTLPKGGVHVGAGMTVDIPVTRAIDAIDTAKDVADAYREDSAYQPTEAEQREIFEAAIGLALAAPGPTIDLMLRYGLADGFDAGVRYTVTGIHVDGKLRLLDDPASGWKAALSLGYVHHSFKGLVFDVLEYLQIDDFSRWDVEVPLIVGRDLGQVGKLWFGPKYVYSNVSIDAGLRNVDESLTLDDSMHYFGGFGGIGLGYKQLYAFFELSVMYLVSHPVVFGDEVDLGGLIVVPAGGVMGRF